MCLFLQALSQGHLVSSDKTVAPSQTGKYGWRRHAQKEPVFHFQVDRESQRAQLMSVVSCLYLAQNNA